MVLTVFPGGLYRWKSFTGTGNIEHYTLLNKYIHTRNSKSVARSVVVLVHDRYLTNRRTKTVEVVEVV